MEQTAPILTKNIAETLAEVLPRANVVYEAGHHVEGLSILQIAVPKACDLREVRTDLEALLPRPRRTKASAQFSDCASFLAYVQRHAAPGSAVWCQFDPQTFALQFTAVFDEHEHLVGQRHHERSAAVGQRAERHADQHGQQ